MTNVFRTLPSPSRDRAPLRAVAMGQDDADRSRVASYLSPTSAGRPLKPAEPFGSAGSGTFAQTLHRQRTLQLCQGTARNIEPRNRAVARAVGKPGRKIQTDYHLPRFLCASAPIKSAEFTANSVVTLPPSRAPPKIAPADARPFNHGSFHGVWTSSDWHRRRVRKRSGALVQMREVALPPRFSKWTDRNARPPSDFR